MLVTKSDTTTPLASRIQKIPTVNIPSIPRMIAIQMIGPVQHLTRTRKMIARNMAAKTAVKRTGQPYLRSYAHCSYESKLKKVLRFIPLTDEGTQYDYTGVDA